MISFSAVVVKTGLNESFYAELKPISNDWNPLKNSGAIFISPPFQLT
ncbi:hypothetical protein DOJK_00729 [Patescibacteria group bacterium]|nr:hypothetical protein DOJK_00729 [Patescibacteria group bacterium]